MTGSAREECSKQSEGGLSSAEAVALLASEGPNELPRAGHRSPFRIVVEVVREPMLALLLAGGLAYFLLGDPAEALILLAFASFSILVTVVQETRTEHVLEALRDLSSPRALVIRDGKRQRIAGREVVRGDLLVLGQGDRVAADGVLQQAEDLQLDESLLTGEALPVGKRVATDADREEAGRPGGEGQPFVYSGSLVTRGAAIARVVATGVRSEMGRIGLALATLDSEPPRLQRETARVVRLCAFGGGAVACLVVLLFGLLRGGWIEALLAGIAIGMSMLPEEFPVVLTIFLAMGAWRIARANVLTRKAAAIETLGSATVLCTDKTGTLTENRMAVTRLWLPSGESVALEAVGSAEGPFRDLLANSVLASAPVPVDPMEIAFYSAVAKVDDRWDLVHTYGLRPDLLAMSNVWQNPNVPGRQLITAKGAPEAIADLCRLAAAERERLTRAVDAMAGEGMRVIGVAIAHSDGPSVASSQRDYEFALSGLIGLSDPLRSAVPAAVVECLGAGIKVVMITGDYAATARSIAAKAGIEDGDVLTGEELDRLDESALATRLRTATVFARIMPEQKLRIVRAFKANGEVVAMTGDGVNDAPSLKAAHIGIAMGKRGTDVAREASAIVLLDDDFGSIVKAIRLGRRIYDNIRKAMAFIFAVHVPIAGLALLPLLTGLPILFGPIHIALLEMIIDPACALVFEGEPEESDVMRRKPRDPDARLFSLRMVSWSVIEGGLALVMTSALFVGGSLAGMSEPEVRAVTFFALVGAIFALIFANRSFDTSFVHALLGANKALRYVAAGVTAAAIVILSVAPVRMLLGFGEATGMAMISLASSAVVMLAAFEALKRTAGTARRRDIAAV